MQKKNLVFACLIAGAIVFLTNFLSDTKNEVTPHKRNIQTVPLNKVFHIGFDNGLNPTLLNGENIYVLDSQNRKVAVTINKLNSKEISITPPMKGYSLNNSYTLHINRDLDLENVGDKQLPQEYIIDFIIRQS